MNRKFFRIYNITIFLNGEIKMADILQKKQSEILTVKDGKATQVVSKKQLENRKDNFQKRIVSLQDQITKINEEIAKFQAQVTDLDTIIVQLVD